MFKIGDRVCIKEDSKITGEVVALFTHSNKQSKYTVIWDNKLHKNLYKNPINESLLILEEEIITSKLIPVVERKKSCKNILKQEIIIETNNLTLEPLVNRKLLNKDLLTDKNPRLLLNDLIKTINDLEDSIGKGTLTNELKRLCGKIEKLVEKKEFYNTINHTLKHSRIGLSNKY